jgi:ABC-type polysaccharide/polyol phosphate transport system ATPase subunit
VLVVSHDLEFMKQSCNRAIWIDRGKLRFAGTTTEAVDYYLKTVNATQWDSIAKT